MKLNHHNRRHSSSWFSSRLEYSSIVGSQSRVALALLLSLVPTVGAQSSDAVTYTNDTSSEVNAPAPEDVATEQAYTVLFPWVAQAIGIVVYFLLTRFVHAIPYTGVLFIIGTCMGAGVAQSGQTDQLTESISMWIGISYRVLFACFLPGLLFKDALEINFHLFVSSFWQIFYLAFPMVLIGTVLTALVGVYIFPYGWSFHLALTFGSILAATDPVAVCVLLNEVGAPPRLKMHISGESLWNDGSAVVFYASFSALFLNDLGIPRLGTDVTVAEGFKIFFRMSLGGVAIGLAYTLALVFILYKLSRRLDVDDTVLQVAATATVAYLAFYTADMLCRASGVIAVVVLGTATKAFGGSFINDWQIMDSFWSLLEHLLNTILFTLGGIEFGQVVASNDGKIWSGEDWGYLVVLYLFVNIIRFFCLFASYPLLTRIGLSTNWQEMVFSGWAGLRGAVGITLALGLDSEVSAATDNPDQVGLTRKVFGMVGGVAFLTLIINGSLSRLLLEKLGLADSSASRKRILQAAEDAAKRQIVNDFLDVMTDTRFAFVDFALIKFHCPLLASLTAKELEDAARERKETQNPLLYRQPNLNHVFPYLQGSGKLRASLARIQWDAFMHPDVMLGRDASDCRDGVGNESELLGVYHDFTVTDAPSEDNISQEKPNADLVKGIRLMFVELLRAAYHAQIKDGELDTREYKGFLVYNLLQSLEFAHDAANAGEPLDDWKTSQIVSPEVVDKVEDFGHRLCHCFRFRKIEPHQGKGSADTDQSSSTLNVRLAKLRDEQPLKYQLLRLNVLRAFSFIDAHKEAEERLQDEFGKETGELFAAFQVVLRESRNQVRKAGKVLRLTKRKQLRHVISHYLCRILQNKIARYYQLLFDTGVLLPREARHLLQELEGQMAETQSCCLDRHPGSIEYVHGGKVDVESQATAAVNARQRKRAKRNAIL